MTGRIHFELKVLPRIPEEKEMTLQEMEKIEELLKKPLLKAKRWDSTTKLVPLKKKDLSNNEIETSLLFIPAVRNVLTLAPLKKEHKGSLACLEEEGL